MVSFMASFVLSFSPLDVLDGIWDLIESFLRDFLPTLSTSLRSTNPLPWFLRHLVVWFAWKIPNS